MTVQMIILYMDRLVTIINDLNLNLNLKGNFGLGREGGQQAVTDKFLCIVTGCVLGTDVCQSQGQGQGQGQGQEDSPLMPQVGTIPYLCMY